ncbi:MAG TPA: hypothetical protein VN248_03195 [Arenimonas sp.]|nr:hypothetical protein [Arenimonas sp.]
MTPDDIAPKTEAGYRSRWGRFSPAMGWKAFWSEIVIVVLGVVIALAANEAVQNWSWQNKVRDGEVRLQSDLSYVFTVAAEQVVIAPCAEAQLSALSQKLVKSGSVWDPVTVHVDDGTSIRWVIRIPARSQMFPVWDSLVADGTAARFPQDRQVIYGNISARITRAQNQSDEANQLVRRLLALGHPMVLSDDTRRYFLVMTEEIRALIDVSELSAKQRMVSIAGSREAKVSATEAKQVETYLKESGTIKFCKAQGLPLANWRDALKQ